VARLLEAGDFRLVDVERKPGYAPGRPEWLDAPQRHPELERAVRLWPQHASGEGHFAAVMLRAGIGQLGDQGLGVQVPSNQVLWDKATSNQSIRDQVGAFWQEALEVGLPMGGRLQVAGSYLYWMPPQAPDLGGLRAIHPGWWLGTFKKGRFEPSQALAMGLRAQDARRCLDLPADSAQCAAYLRGEVLAAPGDNGWLLVCVEGFPLGWGKRTASVVKNYYPKGLRKAR
jgi:NOL1/NOP2/fmu family ribosome biogenesis protein